jgi:hypothetical protein
VLRPVRRGSGRRGNVPRGSGLARLLLSACVVSVPVGTAGALAQDVQGGTREGALMTETRITEALMSEATAVRTGYREYWNALGAAGVVGLERFARTVQNVVDTRAPGAGGSGERLARTVLDDLVDLFVSETYLLEKSLVMSTPSVLGGQSVRERPADLTGFAPRFQAGEGRFRHFALNAAAALSAPDALVDLAARLRGRDLLGASTDSSADRATNRIGRDFARLLRERSPAELADGETVRAWVADRFGQ